MILHTKISITFHENITAKFIKNRNKIQFYRLHNYNLLQECNIKKKSLKYFHHLASPLLHED